jgi:DNA-binding CsgD family transcriptional regulator
MNAVGGTALVGRAVEQRALRDVLVAVRDGMSGTLILTGEAGIGKTALLEDIAASASDMDVLRVVGIESEMSLGFAALHQLLHPLLDQLASLPSPQADALRAAFGMGDSVAADQFFVGLATLTLLSNAAMKRGLVLLVDDAQWLDHESESVLAFVARRLYADRIAIFVAVREPPERELAMQALPGLPLRGLEQPASLELMSSALDGPVDDDLRSRVLGDAQGNPLAIVELTRELTRRASPTSALLPQPLALGRQLEARFLRQVRELPAPTQRLLLTAAAEPTGDVALLWRAGEALDFDEDAAKEAEAADLMSFGPPIRFRHPLIREAIYHGANESDRRRTHAALADATDIALDPDRHAWHRAAATLAPDEDVASELEAAAMRAQQLGGFASTAALLARAAQLTPDPTRRGLRLLQAAASDLTAGQLPRAQATLEMSMPMLPDPFVSAQAKRLEAAIQFRLGTGADAPAIMLQAARELHELDPRLARETALEALQLAVLFGKYASARTRDVALVAQSLPLPDGEAPSTSDLLLDGLAEFFLSGPGVAVPVLQRALQLLRNDRGARDNPRRMSFGMWAAFAVGDHDAMRALGDEYVAIGRNGALDHLPEALHYIGMLELRVGTLARAETSFAEEGDLQQMRSIYSSGNIGQMIVLAWRGNEAATREAAPPLAEMARERRLGWTAARVDAALATLDLGLGNYRAATNGATDGWLDDIAINVFTAADAVEAHVRSGTPERAAEYLDCLEDRAGATKMPLELGLLARSHALLADDDGAEAQHEDAISRLTENGGQLHLARAQLLYGEWLRRRKRRRDAREILRAAYDAFSGLGAVAFAERARVELLATGETARKRVDDTRDDLTPQETQIATLAAGGATNPEIAAQMFISASTVEYHLRKVYRKLGISSRRTLASALPSD